jgi:hypothetical protein
LPAVNLAAEALQDLNKNALKKISDYNDWFLSKFKDLQDIIELKSIRFFARLLEQLMTFKDTLERLKSQFQAVSRSRSRVVNHGGNVEKSPNLQKD